MSTRFFYNYAIGLAPIVAEKNDTTNQFRRFYVWTPDGVLLYMIDATDGNNVSFYHFDRTGSTLALTDRNGMVTDAYAYGPYGEVLAHQGRSDQPFTYQSRWGVRQEGSSGTLYHLRARYYDATTARFMSRDPIWPQLGTPKEVNPYLYLGNDPVANADPLGTSLFNNLWQFNEGEEQFNEITPDPDNVPNTTQRDQNQASNQQIANREREALRSGLSQMDDEPMDPFAGQLERQRRALGLSLPRLNAGQAQQVFSFAGQLERQRWALGLSLPRLNAGQAQQESPMYSFAGQRMYSFAGQRSWVHKFMQPLERQPRAQQGSLRPRARSLRATCHERQRYMWIFGGEDATGEELKDTWEFLFAPE